MSIVKECLHFCKTEVQEDRLGIDKMRRMIRLQGQLVEHVKGLVQPPVDQEAADLMAVIAMFTMSVIIVGLFEISMSETLRGIGEKSSDEQLQLAQIQMDEITTLLETFNVNRKVMGRILNAKAGLPESQDQSPVMEDVFGKTQTLH